MDSTYTSHPHDCICSRCENLAKEIANRPSGETACSAISDTDRINWLQTNQQTVWRAYHDEWEQTTEAGFRRQRIEVFDGWVVKEMDEPNPDIRKAIDSAILSPNDQAEARRNGALPPEKTSPPLPPATGSPS